LLAAVLARPRLGAAENGLDLGYDVRLGVLESAALAYPLCENAQCASMAAAVAMMHLDRVD
jgi:hypothetical protein